MAVRAEAGGAAGAVGARLGGRLAEAPWEGAAEGCAARAGAAGAVDSAAGAGAVDCPLLRPTTNITSTAAPKRASNLRPSRSSEGDDSTNGRGGVAKVDVSGASAGSALAGSPMPAFSESRSPEGRMSS